MAFVILHNPHMDITQIISVNLVAWMDGHKKLNTLEKLAEASGVGFGTVRRIRNNEGNPTVKNIAAIAHAFRRKPTDLLTPPPEIYEFSTSTVLTAQEMKADEYQVLEGYRHGSDETRDLMRTLAVRSIEAFEPRSEKN